MSVRIVEPTAADCDASTAEYVAPTWITTKRKMNNNFKVVDASVRWDGWGTSAKSANARAIRAKSTAPV
jgi:hypothetical protein